MGILLFFINFIVENLLISPVNFYNILQEWLKIIKMLYGLIGLPFSGEASITGNRTE